MNKTGWTLLLYKYKIYKYFIFKRHKQIAVQSQTRWMHVSVRPSGNFMCVCKRERESRDEGMFLHLIWVTHIPDWFHLDLCFFVPLLDWGPGGGSPFTHTPPEYTHTQYTCIAHVNIALTCTHTIPPHTHSRCGTERRQKTRETRDAC